MGTVGTDSCGKENSLTVILLGPTTDDPCITALLDSSAGLMSTAGLEVGKIIFTCGGDLSMEEAQSIKWYILIITSNFRLSRLGEFLKVYICGQVTFSDDSLTGLHWSRPPVVLDFYAMASRATLSEVNFLLVV